MSEKIYDSRNCCETYEIGRLTGKTLCKGDVVAIYGELGSGKTVLAKGIAAGLGLSTDVTSPTYTFINAYGEPVLMYHMDMYRICHPEEAEEIGFQEYLSDECVCVIEWAERVEELLPETRTDIWIVKDAEKGEGYRRITVTGRSGNESTGCQHVF